MISVQTGSTFEDFETLLMTEDYENHVAFGVSASLRPDRIHLNVEPQLDCPDCQASGIECMWREASADLKPSCERCAKRREECELSFLPRQLFNIRLRTKNGNENTTGLSTLAEVTAEPSTSREDCARDEDIVEAIREVERHIYQKEAELARAVCSLATSVMDRLGERSLESLPMHPPSQRRSKGN